MGSGWIMRDMPHFDTSLGFGVAHDVLEHFDHGDCVTDEFQAFGAILWGRVNGCYASLAETGVSEFSHKSLASDLGEMLVREKLVIPDVRTRPLADDGYEPEKKLDELRMLIWQSVAHFDDELNGTPTFRGYDAAVDLTLAWMRVGYRRAARRWGHTNPESLASMFWEMEREVDALTKRGPEWRELRENDMLIVSVTPARMKYMVRLDPYKDPFDYEH